MRNEELSTTVICSLLARCENLSSVLRECAEWLESRPDYTEGDAAVAAKARYVLEHITLPIPRD